MTTLTPAQATISAEEQLQRFYAEARTTPEAWKTYTGDVHLRAASMTAGYLESPEGHVIPGLVFQTDREGGQEYLSGEIHDVLTGKDPGNFLITPDGLDHVAVFSDDSGLILSRYRVTAREIAWGDPLPTGMGSDRYAHYWNDNLRWLREFPLPMDVRYVTMEKLRELARSIGIEGTLPRSKTGLGDRIREHALATIPGRDLWPMSGASDFFVLRATGDGRTANVVRGLVQAARNGTLMIGHASGPFHSGMMLMDGSLVTDDVHADNRRMLREYNHLVSKLGDRAARLEELHGGRGSASVSMPRVEEDGSERYWLRIDGRGYPRDEQVRAFGWVSIETIDTLIADPQMPNRFKQELTEAVTQASQGGRDAGYLTEWTLPTLPNEDGSEPLYSFSLLDENRNYLYSRTSLTIEEVRKVCENPDAAIVDEQRRREQDKVRYAENIARRRAEKQAELDAAHASQRAAGYDTAERETLDSWDYLR